MRDNICSPKAHRQNNRPDAYLVRGAFKDEHRDVANSIIPHLEGNWEVRSPDELGSGELEDDEFAIVGIFNTLSGARRVEDRLSRMETCLESAVSEYRPNG